MYLVVVARAFLHVITQRQDGEYSLKCVLVGAPSVVRDICCKAETRVHSVVVKSCVFSLFQEAGRRVQIVEFRAGANERIDVQYGPAGEDTSFGHHFSIFLWYS